MKKNRTAVVIISILFISILTLQCSMDGRKSLLGGEDIQNIAEGGRSSFPSSSTESASNNLSVPVIWSDGVGIVLPGDPDVESFVNSIPLVLEDGSVVDVYPQQDPMNSWQAESFTAVPGEPDILIDYIDWGDDLEAKSWPLGSKIRVETALYKSFPELDAGMKGYEMYYLEGQGTNELWGTSGISGKYSHEGMNGYNALIYTDCAKLVIQKITGDTGDAVWSEDGEYGGVWKGSGFAEPVFNRGVWDSEPGDSGGYSAEINIGGKVIYGFNWDTRILADGLGTYRITFALVDGDLPSKPALNTMMDETTKIFLEVEEDISLASTGSDSGEPDQGGASAFILGKYNLTYIDVTLTDKGGKGR